MKFIQKEEKGQMHNEDMRDERETNNFQLVLI